MLQFGESFEYNGKKSSEFNVKMARFDNLEIPTGLSREINKGSINFYKTKANHYGTLYSDVLIFEIHLIKDICDNPNNFFTKDDIRKINAWLTSPNVPKKLHVYNYDYENETEYDYYGIFTDIKYEIGASGYDNEYYEENNIADQKVAGIIATFTCDSPFGYINKTQEIDVNSTTNITIIIDSDEWDKYIYPLIKVESKNVSGTSERTFSIKNESDNNREFQLSISDNYTFWIDSDKMTIYDEIGLINLDDLGIEDEGYIYLPRLVNGSNNLVFSGDCKVTLYWEEPRKTGAW